MTKKGFTLLEVVVVVIILGILAAVGLVQYTKMLEKGRTAEAKAVLSLIRTAEHAYKQQYGGYTATLGVLGIDNPAATCTSTHYFSYNIDAAQGTAIRCTSGGKAPSAGGAYTITLDYSTGTFSGDATYY